VQHKILSREEEKTKRSMLSAHVKEWHIWFSEGQFYIYGVVYMLVRIAVNVTMSVQPFYLIHVTGFIKTKDNPTPIAIALTPLLSYVTSLIFSLMLYKPMLQRLRNRFYPLFLSVMIISLGSLPYVFLDSNPDVRWVVYLLSSIQGVGLAIMLNTATSLISDVIGKDAESSAFVYGAYSFFDKITNGVIIFFITANFNENPTALRWIIGTTPIFCSLAAFSLTYLGKILYSERLARLSLEEKREVPLLPSPPVE
jgi:Na+/melibiose symporter-like transporter